MDTQMPTEAVAALKTAISAGATKAISDLSQRVVASIGSNIAKPLREIALNLSTNFGPHLAATYERATKLKTLINLDEPVDLLSLYVNLKFVCGTKSFDDYKAIEEIRARKRVIISGTGGGGKTVFTKYLWLSLFERPEGRIPLFIELRRLNELEKDDLLALIYHSIVSSNAKLPREAFDKAIAGGLFAIILDGFDEVALDKKDRAERQILDLAANNPNCIVVVSGRPDEKFDSWQTFSNFRVQPLKRDQVEQLITKLDFDRIIKRKFLARLKTDLYEKHKSFLSTPLLATLMLLTFNQYADIPEKVHLFYEQAFDTLFARHDALKEAFKRDMHSNLSIDVFKRYFSYFCLVSYFDAKIEFTEAELKRYISKGLRIDGEKLNVDKFIRDLTESVCVIQRDGLNFVFTHRTFQEFFTAYCLARFPAKHFRPVVLKVADRKSDNVLKMLYDMNETLLEMEYLSPEIEDFLRKFDEHPDNDFLHRFISEGSVTIHALGNRPTISHFEPEHVRFTARKLFASDYAPIDKAMERFKKKDINSIKKITDQWSEEFGRNWHAQVDVDPKGNARVSIFVGSNLKRTEPAPWFKDSGFGDYAILDMNILRKVARKLSRKASKKNNVIDAIFRT